MSTAARKSRMVVLAGEPEYDSHNTMRVLSEDIAAALDLALDYRTPTVIEDTPEFPESSFGSLEALGDADLLVVYTRFRRLPDAEMEALHDYLQRGRAVVGLRTSSHAFSFDPSSRWASWNDGFGRDVLGSPWSSHHGHSSSTDVTVLPGAPAELVAGLPEAFHVRSWLYRTELQPWCRPVLAGVPVSPESEPTPGPVAWVGVPDGRRTFYTSLGHPDDFEQAEFRSLLHNAVAWTLAKG
jgi:type 1 glutamine amidotransferase